MNSEEIENPTGKIYLVGSGSGDPGLVTYRAVECLRSCDVVIYDYLVNHEILKHASDSAELICVGQHGKGRILTQDEINELFVLKAQNGKTVVRLKGGDPTIFARITEEIGALKKAKINYEVVPGISAALAAGSYAEIPLTQSDCSSAVAFVTGQEKKGKPFSRLDFRSLAEFPGTIVIYMGTTTVRRWSTELMDAGKPADCDVLVVRRCSFPDQSSFRCKLSEVAEKCESPSKLRPPALFIIGDVVQFAPLRSWFESRPLFGKRILLARPGHQNSTAAKVFSELGAIVSIQPAIQIQPPDDFQPLDDAIERCHEFDWIVFSSTNGVDRFVERINHLGFDLRVLGNSKIAAVGSSTANRLSELWIKPDFVPSEFRGEALAAGLAPQVDGKRVLLIRASRGREVLRDTLQKHGANVSQVVAYKSVDTSSANPPNTELLNNGEIDWIIASSSAIANSLVNLFGDRLNQAKLASISPITSKALRDQGFEPATEAKTYTIEGIAKSILDYESSK